jgi:perosamine synthetase
VLRSGRLSIGPRRARFEEMVADRTGRRHGIAVSSGTAGLHTVLTAMDIGPGDEVITTPFSFVASANSILYTGATPVFVDIEPGSLNLDPTKLEKAITAKTKAILPVEVFGNPRNIDQVCRVALRHEIPVVEDACEALGGRYKDRPIGSFGRAAVFAFYPNKPITTGEGGMIVTDDDTLAETCRSLRNQGRSQLGREYEPSADRMLGTDLTHERLGFNYRLSEIACAMGIAQMERLEEMLEARRQVAASYTKHLMSFEELILPAVDSATAPHMSWFVFVVRLNDRWNAQQRDRIIAGLRRHEIGAAHYFPPIHLQPFYRQCFGYAPGSFPVCESIAERTIALPFFNRLDETSIELVVQTLRVMLEREKLLMQDE